MRRTISAATLFMVTLGAVLFAADNWPQGRGPELEGRRAEVGLARSWSAGTNIASRLPTPSRTGSTPIIWGDTILPIVATAEFIGNLELWAVDRNNQTVIWKKPLGPGNKAGRKQNMSSPSPVTDGRMVWVMTGTGIVKAFDVAGTEKWTRDIQEDHGAFVLGFGYASSPLLLDGDLIVQVLHGAQTDDPSYVLRIDGATGKTEWKAERPADARLEPPAADTTATVVHSGRRSEIVITGDDVANAPNYRLIAAPIVWKGIEITPPRLQPMRTLDVAHGAGGRPKTPWSFDQGVDIPPPGTDGSLLYIVRNNGAAFALDLATGEVVDDPERLPPGIFSGSPALADDHIYVTTDEGVTSVYSGSDVRARR